MNIDLRQKLWVWNWRWSVADVDRVGAMLDRGDDEFLIAQAFRTTVDDVRSLLARNDGLIGGGRRG